MFFFLVARVSCKYIFSNLVWHNPFSHTLQLSLREITKAGFVGCAFPNTQSSGIFQRKQGSIYPSCVRPHTATADLVSWESDDPEQTVGRREAMLGQRNSFGVHCVGYVTPQQGCIQGDRQGGQRTAEKPS